MGCSGAGRWGGGDARLSAERLSAFNYTVNECWETGGSRSVFALW